LDHHDPSTFFGNSALRNGPTYSLFTDGLLFFQANPTGSSHNLNIDNANGVGTVAFDYAEIITVTGGTPCVVICGAFGSVA